MFISSFCSKLMIWVPVFFPSLLVPCAFSFNSTFHSFHFSLYFATILNHFCEHPDYQCFEFCIWQVAISSWLSSIFGALICSFIWAYFFVSVGLLHSKWWSLSCSPEQGGGAVSWGWRPFHVGSSGRILLSFVSATPSRLFKKWVQYLLSQRYLKNGTEVGWSSNTTVQNLYLRTDRVGWARHSWPSMFILAHRTSRGVRALSAHKAEGFFFCLNSLHF